MVVVTTSEYADPGGVYVAPLALVLTAVNCVGDVVVVVRAGFDLRPDVVAPALEALLPLAAVVAVTPVVAPWLEGASVVVDPAPAAW